MAKEEGVTLLLRKLFTKLIYRRKTLVFMRCDLNTLTAQHELSELYEIRVLQAEDLVHCRVYFEDHRKIYEALLKDKHVAYAAFEKSTNNIIGICWFAENDYHDWHYHQCTFPVGTNQVLVFAGEVAPEFRKQKVGVNLMQDGLAYYRKKGREEAISTIASTNKPSFRTMFSIGWTEAGKLKHFHKLFGYRWQTVSQYNGERFNHFRRRFP